MHAPQVRARASCSFCPRGLAAPGNVDAATQRTKSCGRVPARREAAWRASVQLRRQMFACQSKTATFSQRGGPLPSAGLRPGPEPDAVSDPEPVPAVPSFPGTTAGPWSPAGPSASVTLGGRADLAALGTVSPPLR